MTNYLLIESRDPFESNDVSYFYDLATGLAKDGNEVTLFLVQNGVEEDVAKLTTKGVKVFIVQEDLAERGLEHPDLIPGVEPISAAGLPKLLASYKQVWHW
ncbi:MAG: sulfur reduction protein DsrE [Acidobacteria bacterium]|nr:sulfur reduction protein DsrE [Acidobacteriota bacterium]